MAKQRRDVALSWVRPTHQERSRDTHHRIVEAAERLLSRGRSWADLTVAELVDEAETSTGSFYSRFRDKDTLLHVLQIELTTQGQATVRQALELVDKALPFADLVRACVTVAIRSYRAQAGLRRALLVEMCTQPKFRSRSIALSRETCAALVKVIAPYVRTKDKKRIAEVVDISHRMVYGTLDQNLLYEDPPTGRKATDKFLIAELTDALVAYAAAQLGDRVTATRSRRRIPAGRPARPRRPR